MSSTVFNCIIAGAAGRDFHDFQTFFRDHPEFRVRAFTATQIPFIESRSFPRELAGLGYDDDIPIYGESRLAELVERYHADFVFLSYSDLSYEEVMHKASLVQSCGASFVLLGPRHTALRSRRPVVSVTAVRTGAGKSPLTQALALHLARAGKRVAVLRHPMPYGDLKRQAVERFSAEEDLDRYECTIEEREEYEPYIELGLVVFAGVDYRAILAAAEVEAEVILWDGGNNDYPFLRPNLSVVVVDPLRPGHELSYYPGETNLRMADVVVISKVRSARPEDVVLVRQHVVDRNARAEIIEADLAIEIDHPELIAGKRVLVVEDGPTVTHGGMRYGAGVIAARQAGAKELVDPRPHAVGTIAEAYAKYPHLGAVLPALGYSEVQRHELSRTIAASDAEVVVDASPSRLTRSDVQIDLPIARVRYRFEQVSGLPIFDLVSRKLASLDPASRAKR